MTLAAPSHDREAAQILAIELCWLLSFATGRSVFGPLLAVHRQGRKVIGISFHAPYFETREPLLPLVPVQHPCELIELLAQTYPRWHHLMQHATPLGEKKSASDALREAMAAYLSSLSLPPFPIPFYEVAYAFEVLINSDLFVGTEDQYAVDDVRQQLFASFHSWAETAAALLESDSPGRARQFRNSTKNMFNNLMRRSFVVSIKALLDQYNVPYRGKDVRRLVKARNDSVHGSFSSSTGHALASLPALASSQRLLELLLLRILGYTGSATDRTHDDYPFVPLPWAVV
jgi:hypothetical protein